LRRWPARQSSSSRTTCRIPTRTSSRFLLHRSGGVELANRLTALAGPKVFSDRNRRFSRLCFGTIKVPQSAGVSSEEAVLDARVVARAARRSIEVARERLDRGDARVLFAEGRRSQTASMQPLLAGVTRYLEKTDAWVVPMVMTGPEALFPVDDPTLRPTRVVLEIGAPM